MDNTDTGVSQDSFQLSLLVHGIPSLIRLAKQVSQYGFEESAGPRVVFLSPHAVNSVADAWPSDPPSHPPESSLASAGRAKPFQNELAQWPKEGAVHHPKLCAVRLPGSTNL